MSDRKFCVFEAELLVFRLAFFDGVLLPFFDAFICRYSTLIEVCLLPLFDGKLVEVCLC